MIPGFLDDQTIVLMICGPYGSRWPINHMGQAGRKAAEAA